MSKKFLKVRNHYTKGYWSVSMVRDAVDKDWITAAEFEEITGEKY